MSPRRALCLTFPAALLLLGLPLPARAQPPQRVIDLTVFGDDPCPQAQDPEEIVVCARRPESERYRIPRRFRDRGDRPMEVSWGARAMDLEDAQRDTRPNSCSVVGSFGQTGCTQMMIRQWSRERQALARERDAQR